MERPKPGEGQIVSWACMGAAQYLSCRRLKGLARFGQKVCCIVFRAAAAELVIPAAEGTAGVSIKEVI